MSDNKSGGDFLENTRRNPWMLSSLVLGALLVVSLGYMMFNGASEMGIEKNIQSFLSSQGLNGQVLSIDDTYGGMHMASVDVGGQVVPVYISPDGNYLFSNGINIGDSSEATANGNGYQQEVVDVPKSDLPKVELFVMSHCPYGTQVEKGMLPVAGLLGDKIDFDVKFVYYAMHGKTEVDEQLNQYCIQKEQNAKYLPYLKCFLEDGDGVSCLKNASINTVMMKSCVAKADKEFGVTDSYNDKSSWLSGQFPLFNVYKEDNDKYSVAGSPTVVINGAEVQTGRDSVSLLNSICGAFNNAPAECDTELKSVTPGPGFGWDSAGASNLAACGV